MSKYSVVIICGAYPESHSTKTFVEQKRFHNALP